MYGRVTNGVDPVNEYMFGNALLIRPIISSDDSINVYLPEGRWRAFLKPAVYDSTSLKNVFNRRNRILLKELVITDFKLRYQGSALGYLWSLLKPLMLFAILYVVFVKFLKFGSDIEHFPVYLLLGIVMWNFFIEATFQGMRAIVDRGDLIRKISFLISSRARLSFRKGCLTDAMKEARF